jgi:hypothetical protein
LSLLSATAHQPSCSSAFGLFIFKALTCLIRFATAFSSMNQAVPPNKTTNSTAITSAATLPPFRSTTQFPRNPKQEKLPSSYANCFLALREANVARSILKARIESKKQAISAIRIEIERVEQDLLLEAGTRTRLHGMNLRLIDALRQMEGFAGELGEAVSEGHQVPRTRLRRLIERLKALVHQWRAFKRDVREAIAGGGGVAQDGGRDA